MEISKSKVYIQIDDQGRITRCEGGYFIPADLTGWTEIDEGTGDCYNLCQNNYFEGGLYTYDGICRWKYVENVCILRTEEELKNDILQRDLNFPTFQEQLRADIDYISIMLGVDL